jgi:hypothetical protein
MSGAALSQGIYFKAGGSYNLGLPSYDLASNSTSTIDTSITSITTTTNEKVYGSFGKGVGFDGTIGYKGENLGIEVGVSYFLNSSVETTTKYFYPSYSVNYSSSYESTMLAISPCFVFVTSVGFYGRAGAILGFPTLANKSHYTVSNNLYDYTFEYSGNTALGFTGAVGFAINGGGIKLYLEADVVSLTWAPTSAEVTEWKMNGRDVLSGLTVSQKKVKFEETTTFTNPSSAASSNPNVESVQSKTYHPYSSVGLKAGIMIGF